MAKIIVPMTNLFEDVEYTEPKKALEQAGHEVTLVGETAGETITGKKGLEVTVDKGIDDIQAADYDALLIPGGFSPDQLRADQRMVDLVQHFLENDKPVFAICHGPQLFIQTGLTEGRKMTAYQTVQPDLKYAGAQVSDDAVVIDNNLVTSRNPDDIPQFNEAIIAHLEHL
ncbi:type 1 glutamine amidotransferase [Lactobacillus sp. CC-MHH1034]|uniref:type 1 glutamine amidotransferase domain-containing protein n=1 Tax=Agrilactobacillus fermenti TaxID=2586909 RepID=UPI001E54C04A|nr:type 1 glutamine amidotransferase domain-containing protein [Agrilactobacillus fermenti]MCD2255694.1 type 1 glutamine amidotransferase [Agrilactobacillus fermenti]